MILCTSDRCLFFYFILSISNVSGNGIILVCIFFSLQFMNSLKGSHELPKFGQPCLCAFFWTEIHSFHPILKKLCEPPQKRLRTTYFNNELRGFPGGAVVENLPAKAGDTGYSPGLGRSHMQRSD